MKRLAIIVVVLSMVMAGCSSSSNQKYGIIDGEKVLVHESQDSDSPDDNIVYEVITVGDSKLVKTGPNLWCDEKYKNEYIGFTNSNTCPNCYNYNFTMFPRLDAEGKPVKCEVK